MKIYVGTSGYSYKEWKGKFYPKGTSSSAMLRHYSERLDTVEINNTFYRMPTEGVLLSWAEQVPESFIFTIKAPQVITHFKQLRNVGDEIEYLFRTLSVLGIKLGPVLFQLPGSFRADLDALKEFLDILPDGISCVFEFRSETWRVPKVYDLLREKSCSLCAADTDERPAAEIVSTAPFGYLRLRRSEYADADLSQWIEKMLAQKWREAFVFFKHEEEAIGPETALRFKELCDYFSRK